MANAGWEEEDLEEISRDSCLTKLALELGLDLESWISKTTSPLPETLRVTKSRKDREWTISELEKMGASPIPWMPDDSAWQMPFSRGKVPEGYSKRILTILHDSGRITRQEAASMLPVELLNPKDGDMILDLCAAPGSKTTQLAEKISPEGFVIANEPVSGRANMLISNRARLALPNILINQQDGRHIGRVPPPGFDAVLTDVPCTGTATTRKNRKIWKKWTPKSSRGLFELQVSIVTRGAKLLRPNGKLVYSTCSIDPCENEAVVAEILRQCPWLELIKIDETLVEGLIMKPGLKQWNILDENGDRVELGEQMPRLPNLKIKHLCSEDRAKFDLEFDSEIEDKISEDLVMCRRLYHNDNDTGGFFVAIFRHKPESTPEGIAKAYIPKRKPIEGSSWEPKLMERPKPNRHSVFLAEQETVKQISEGYLIDADKWSWWSRGKRLNIAPKSVIDRLYNRLCPNKRGDLWPEGTFHPLKLIHVGMPTFVKNKGTWRTRQEAIPALEYDLGETCIDVEKEIVIQMLEGWVPTIEEFKERLGLEVLAEGPILLTCPLSGSKSIISAWAGVRVSLMINTLERDILRAKLGIEFENQIGE
jgi:multisite-specific tRNA:(cytosine-C5)-methyltransferase